MAALEVLVGIVIIVGSIFLPLLGLDLLGFSFDMTSLTLFQAALIVFAGLSTGVGFTIGLYWVFVRRVW